MGNCSAFDRALILSHNALSLMFFPVGHTVCTVSLLEGKSRQKFIVKASSAFAIGFLLSAFFWVPAFFGREIYASRSRDAGSDRKSIRRAVSIYIFSVELRRERYAFQNARVSSASRGSLCAFFSLQIKR